MLKIGNQQCFFSFKVQWEQNQGKCGVCGDPYHAETVRNFITTNKTNNEIDITEFRQLLTNILFAVDCKSRKNTLN